MYPGPVRALRFAVLLAFLFVRWSADPGLVRSQDAAEPVSATTSLATGQDWTATSVVVDVGDQVRIQASGSSPMGPLVANGTPAGTASCVPTEQFIAPELPCYALIARIDETAPFLVGDGVTFNVKLPGQLYLGVNDDFFADNEGSWDVTILVTPATAPEEAPSEPSSTPAAETPPQDVAGTPVAPTPLEGGQQVTLLQGSCREPIAVASPAGTTRVPVGSFRGQAGALPVAAVTSLVPFSFDALLVNDFAIAVTAPAAQQGRVLVCGDLGNVAKSSPRETSVGLLPEEKSGWAGIAYLTPSGADPSSTVVTVFVSPVWADAPAG